MNDKQEEEHTLKLPEGTKCSELYRIILAALEDVVNEPEKTAEILQHKIKNPEGFTEEEVMRVLDGAVAEENPKRVKRNDEHYSNNNHLLSKIVQLVPEGKNLVKLKKMICALASEASFLETGYEIDVLSFVDFLASFGKVCGYSEAPDADFNMLLGEGTDYSAFKIASIRLFKLVFFQHRAARASFYELSLLSNFQRLYFKTDAYLLSLLLEITKVFVKQLGRNFLFNYRYIVSEKFLEVFSRKIIGHVNAFNGVVSELGVNQEEIPKIVLVLAVFDAEGENSIMKTDFGNSEMFYCAVRIIADRLGMAAKLEHLIRDKLHWPVKVKYPATLSLLYSSIFCFEYRRFIGQITPVKSNCGPIPRTVLPRENLAGVLTTSIVKRTPKRNSGRAVQAFSPLSRKIGEASKDDKDSFDSRRKLSFD